MPGYIIICGEGTLGVVRRILMADLIVIVDDDPSNLKIAGTILAKHGKRVTALKSGEALLKYMTDHSPDCILLDINMPVMDGFETLKRLRLCEQEKGRAEVPVIFLTADEDLSTESRSFEEGVSDFIRKPFDPDILVRRINNILNKEEKILHFKEEAERDSLTGLLNKSSVGEKLTAAIRSDEGYFLMIDLDSFKLINDIYGHDVGDRILVSFSEIIKSNIDEDAVIGRSGGDEFVAFSRRIRNEEDIRLLSDNLNSELLQAANMLIGPNLTIPLGVSIGAVKVGEEQTDYTTVFVDADRALHKIKNAGKHGYSIFSNEFVSKDGDEQLNLKSISMILAERNISDSALMLEIDSLIHVYRYVMRYISRYHRNACKVLFTVTPSAEGDDVEAACESFCDHLQENLRKSDLIMRFRKDQIFLLFTDIKEDSVESVIKNLIRTWDEKNANTSSIVYEYDVTDNGDQNDNYDQMPRVAVVDDDITNLKLAGHILSKNDMIVTALKSGKALLEYVRKNRPNLILLDVRMPEMDGFETMKRLSEMEKDIANIPVIFLTASDDTESETKGLSLGATDFVRKPFVPEVLVMRAKRIIEMSRLQRNLAHEVEKKTRENDDLFIHVVSSLADAIDAKDKYTNGHSGRVAKYSKEIARRFGYSHKEQTDIYMMALLHDVGKIGISDDVINKPGKLTDEEFEQIKKHPVIGDQILKNIREMPSLAIGARYHHERYDGTGYPDSLKGDNIPEAARIIAVADAYDAMTSFRSYREVMPRLKVREEIENGKGTQFDPRFADIMLQMIDDDKDFTMRERKDGADA